MYLNKNIYIYRQNVSDSLMSSYKANYLDAACILLTKLNNLREKFSDTSSFDRAYKIYTSTMCKKILVNETYRGLRSFNKLCSLVASKKEFIPVIMNNGEGKTKDIIFYKLLAFSKLPQLCFAYVFLVQLYLFKLYSPLVHDLPIFVCHNSTMKTMRLCRKKVVFT